MICNENTDIFLLSIRKSLYLGNEDLNINLQAFKIKSVIVNVRFDFRDTVIDIDCRMRGHCINLICKMRTYIYTNMVSFP